MRASLLLLVIMLNFSGCAQQHNLQGKAPIPDGLYDSEFPVQATSAALGKISSSVKLVSSLTFYRKYVFAAEDQITKHSLLSRPNLYKQAIVTVTDKHASGTATIVYLQNRKTALLTCAHTVSEPDTVIKYVQNKNGLLTEWVRSVSVKIRQSLNVVDLPGNGSVTVLASDSSLDLALLGADIPLNFFPSIPVFTFPLGKSSELNWGTFVYLFGFPHGKKILTNAIVSHPNRNNAHDFIINATMYNGVSGGIILALRDGYPHFELVGIANALPVQQHLIIRPDPDMEIDTGTLDQPYKGAVFLERKTDIIHGMTFAISAENIRLFFRDNEKKLKQQGYFPGDFPLLYWAVQTEDSK